LTAYGDLISTVRPGEWIKPAVMQARAKKAGYLIEKFRAQTPVFRPE
jgi:hypothetical protein